MMLMRVTLSSPGWPEGTIFHGHVDVKIKGQSSLTLWRLSHEAEKAKSILPSKISRDCCVSEDDLEIRHTYVDLLDSRNDDFDKGEVYAEVVAGEGDLLALNPIGRRFSEF